MRLFRKSARGRVPRLELILSSGVAIGGLERLVYHLARRLDPTRLVASVRLVGARGTFAEWVLAELPDRAVWYDRSLVELARLRSDLRRELPSVVHASGLFARGLTLAAVPHAPAVDTVANPDLEHGTVRRYAYRGIGKLAAAYWADSRARADVGIERLGIPRDRIRVIYPGVDEVTIGAEAQRAFLERHGLRATDKIVAVVGNLRVLKGHDRLVEIAQEVTKRDPSVVFVLAGADLSRGEIPRLLEGSSARRNIRLTGFVDDPLPLMAASAVVLQPSRSEGVPRVTLEAMSVGAAILSTAVGGIPEVLTHEETGVLVPANSVGQLTRSLIELLEAPARRAELGARARERVRARFGLDRMVREFEELYLGAAARTVDSRQ
ncbi:MAG: glycosyltransferase family 4 protein [Deltaproteobacteria bacterium]|nr:glycosyltransferase family 4 protein [Deltaproteobacteria bacterium]